MPDSRSARNTSGPPDGTSCRLASPRITEARKERCKSIRGNQEDADGISQQSNRQQEIEHRAAIVARDDMAASTREIGLRLSVGARDVTLVMNWSTVVTSNSVLLSFGVAAATGVFFGFYPARKAAALDPIDALRFE